MTKEEFKPLIYELKTAYIRDKFFDDFHQINLWYEKLSDLNPKYAAQAVDAYIKKGKYQPTIADIRDEYKTILEDAMAKSKGIMDILDAQLSYYPDADKSKETWDILEHIISAHGSNWEEKTAYARKLADQIRDHVRHCEETGERLEPDVKDYLRTLL